MEESKKSHNNGSKKNYIVVFKKTSSRLTIKAFKKIKAKLKAKMTKMTFRIFHTKVDICLHFNT